MLWWLWNNSRIFRFLGGDGAPTHAPVIKCTDLDPTPIPGVGFLAGVGSIPATGDVPIGVIIGHIGPAKAFDLGAPRVVGSGQSYPSDSSILEVSESWSPKSRNEKGKAGE